MPRMIRLAALALAAGTTLAAMAPSQAQADWRYRGGGYHHGYGWRGPAVAGAVVGGLALGAMLGGAYAAPPPPVYYAPPPPPPPVYYAPGYYAPPPAYYYPPPYKPGW